MSKYVLILSVISALFISLIKEIGAAPQHLIEYVVEMDSSTPLDSGLDLYVTFKNLTKMDLKLVQNSKKMTSPLGISQSGFEEDFCLKQQQVLRHPFKVSFLREGRFTIPIFFEVSRAGYPGKIDELLLLVYIQVQKNLDGELIGSLRTVRNLYESYEEKQSNFYAVDEVLSSYIRNPQVSSELDITLISSDSLDMKIDLHSSVLDKEWSAKATLEGCLFWDESGVQVPGWGWSILVWSKKSGKDWSLVGRSVANLDGTWKATYPYFEGASIRLEYVAANRYFETRGPAGNKHSWFDLEIHPTSMSHEVGKRIVRIEGIRRGLGYLYENGIKLWTKLIYADKKMNPVRESPIQVYYPNLDFKCQGLKVWSCTSPSGKVWVIPEHGYSDVIIHELAHQLHYKYWNNVIPGNGHEHNLMDCFDKGTALSEGFAHFLTFYVLTDRETNLPSGRFNIENPGSFGACKDREMNAAWVAAALWDLHDEVSDGFDTINFIENHVVVYHFLTRGYHSRIGEYRRLYTAGQTKSVADSILSIFEQNHS